MSGELIKSPVWTVSDREWNRRLADEFQARDAIRVALINRRQTRELPDDSFGKDAILAGLEIRIPELWAAWRDAVHKLGFEWEGEPVINPGEGEPLLFDGERGHLSSIDLSDHGEILPSDIDWTTMVREQRAYIKAVKKETRKLRAEIYERKRALKKAQRR